MFIEFTVQENIPGFSPSHLFKMLESEIQDWSQVNEIPYTSKYYKNTLRVAFDNEKYYTVFRLTWTDYTPYTDYRLIDRR